MFLPLIADVIPIYADVRKSQTGRSLPSSSPILKLDSSHVDFIDNDIYIVSDDSGYRGQGTSSKTRKKGLYRDIKDSLQQPRSCSNVDFIENNIYETC